MEGLAGNENFFLIQSGDKLRASEDSQEQV